jgi:hypothetical protein
MLEIAEPTTQAWIDRGNDVLDRVLLLRVVSAQTLSRSPIRLFLCIQR